MLCREIIAVCSQIHTKHINTLCGQNVELLNVKLAVHIMTTGLHGVKLRIYGPKRINMYRSHVIHMNQPHCPHACLGSLENRRRPTWNVTLWCSNQQYCITRGWLHNLCLCFSAGIAHTVVCGVDMETAKWREGKRPTAIWGQHSNWSWRN